MRTIMSFTVFLSLASAQLAAQSVFDCVAPASPNLSNPVVLGSGAAASVSTAQLQIALDGGGNIRLNIGTDTLALSATLRITRDTTLDVGGGALSGSSQRRVLLVENPNNLTYTFNLMNARIVDGASTTQSGAGLYKPSGGPWQAVTLRIFNSQFLRNSAVQTAQDDGGGAIYAVGARALIAVGSRFSENSGANGGAIYALGTQRVDVFDSVLQSNRASGTGGNPGNGGNGGAIGIDGADRLVNLCRTQLLDNSAGAFGGGLFTTVYDQTSFTRIDASSISRNNSVGTSNAHTGGVYLQGGPFVINSSTFQDNQASGFGGLAVFDHQTNQGLITSSGSIVNSTFAGNRARTGLGGAMVISATGVVLIQNSTIANNRAECSVCFVGGILNSQNQPLTIRNTIFENNTGGNAFNPWNLRFPTTGSNNLQWPLVRPNSFGQQELAVTPSSSFASALLVAIANNGGPTQTHGLAAGSPAINAGSSIGAPAIDQRGAARDAQPDIGAFELGETSQLFRDGFE